LRDIQWENKQLTNTCRVLTGQLESIQKLQEEDAKAYRSATAKVEALRATLHEMKAAEHHSKSPKTEKGEKFLSLAEELFETVHEEKEANDQQIQKEVENSKKTTQSAKPVLEKAEREGDGKEVLLSKDGLGGKENMTEEEKKDRDAKYEFFALTTLAIKINSGEMMESSYMISAKDLWRKALEEQVTFHQYHRWIQTQFAKASIYHAYTPKRISARQSRTKIAPAKK